MTAFLKTFAFDTHAVRVVMRNDDPWFVASDVCAALGYDHVPHAMRMLDDDERSSVRLVDRTENGGNPNVSIINESGLFSLILRSRKPEAKRFKKWVTSEVLPAIRKTGSYTHPQATPTVNGQISIEMAEYIAMLKQQAELAKLSVQREKTLAAMTIATALMRDGNYSREEIAQIAGVEVHTVDYIFADLCRNAAKQGVHSFRLKTH